jgi:four helix bundle protein
VSGEEIGGDPMAYVSPTRGFRDLRVWQSATDLVVSVYRLTESFPRGEMYGLTLQMQRAVVSVPSNIAEGQAREHLGEYVHHLSIAQGSLAELETQIEISGRLGYATAERVTDLLREAGVVARQLRGLRRSLGSRATYLAPETSMHPAASLNPPKPKTRNPKPRN